MVDSIHSAQTHTDEIFNVLSRAPALPHMCMFVYRDVCVAGGTLRSRLLSCALFSYFLSAPASLPPPRLHPPSPPIKWAGRRPAQMQPRSDTSSGLPGCTSQVHLEPTSPQSF